MKNIDLLLNNIKGYIEWFKMQSFSYPAIIIYSDGSSDGISQVVLDHLNYLIGTGREHNSKCQLPHESPEKSITRLSRIGKSRDAGFLQKLIPSSFYYLKWTLALHLLYTS